MKVFDQEATTTETISWCNRHGARPLIPRARSTGNAEAAPSLRTIEQPAQLSQHYFWTSVKSFSKPSSISEDSWTGIHVPLPQSDSFTKGALQSTRPQSPRLPSSMHPVFGSPYCDIKRLNCVQPSSEWITKKSQARSEIWSLTCRSRAASIRMQACPWSCRQLARLPNPPAGPK